MTEHPLDDVAFTVEVDGGSLSGRSTGSGPALLVLHGGPGLSDYSDMFAGELGGWRALRYTQRGTAPSTAGPPYTVDQHVEDALAVLDAHAVDEAVLLGHSWGGFLACCVAARVPERVSGLVVVDAPGLVGDGGLPEFGAALVERTPAGDRPRLKELDALEASGEVFSDDELAEWLRLAWPAYFADPPRAPAFPDLLAVSARCNADGFASIEEEITSGRSVAALRAFAGPVDVLFGEHSPMPARSAHDIAALFPHATLTGVTGAGHFVWTERPGSLREALVRMAERLCDRQ